MCDVVKVEEARGLRAARPFRARSDAAFRCREAASRAGVPSACVPLGKGTCSVTVDAVDVAAIAVCALRPHCGQAREWPPHAPCQPHG